MISNNVTMTTHWSVIRAALMISASRKARTKLSRPVKRICSPSPVMVMWFRLNWMAVIVG